MPPKKRAAAGGTTAAAKRKKVSIGGTSVMGELDASETHASGRPKRSSIGEPTYNATAAKKSTATSKVTKPSTSKTAVAAAGRGRGRPRKDATAQAEEEHAPATPTKPPKKPVGRPGKSGQTVPQAVEKAIRSPHLVPTAPSVNQGRPKTTKTKDTTVPSTTKPAGKSKTRTKNTKVKGKPIASKAEIDEELDGLTANESDGDEAEEDEGNQYWLMKAEPDSRFEKGVDVKFSIDDLMNAKEPEGWDGVRNVVARNRMRAMKKGDLAFFYHSNTKIPGVAGIMEIVEEHSIDESAFNPASPYYDPKSSRDNPKWELVHVRFVRKFPELVPLFELRKHAQLDGALKDLEMLKQSRLSVSAVKPREWHFILSLAQNDHLDDEPEEPAPLRGQVVKVQEKVVRGLNDDKIVNGYYAESGDEDIKSKFTTASSTAMQYGNLDGLE